MNILNDDRQWIFKGNLFDIIIIWYKGDNEEALIRVN